MKLHLGISPRTTTITGVLIVLIAIGLHFYMRHDARKFESNLPKAPVVQPVDTSSDLVSFSEVEEVTPEPEAVIAEETSLSVVAISEEPEPEKLEAAAGTACENGCDHGDHHGGGNHEPDNGLTNEEFHQLIGEVTTLGTPNVDGKLDKLEDALIARLGPDPRISNLISKWKTAYAIFELSNEVQTTGYNVDDVDHYLNQLPVVVVDDLAEISIALLQPSEEYATALRESVTEIVSQVDTFELLQETRPMVQEAIDVGDILPEEGEAFIQALTGLNVAMSEENHTETEESFEIPSTVHPPR